MLHDKNGHKVDEKGELVFDEQCHNCDAKIPMPLIEQEITEFEKIIDNLPSRIGETPKNIVVDAFRASLIRFARSVMEEEIDNELNRWNSGGEYYDNVTKALTQLKSNVERILKDNEK